jgi:signal transduction histidine kinase
MSFLARVSRRPVALTWFLALATIAVSAAWLGLPPISRGAAAGAAIIAALLALGDITGLPLDDGTELTPAPALLIAGLTVAGWPLLLLATLAGALLSAPADRRTPARALQYAGTRCLLIALAAPIYAVTQPPDAPPYTTPLAIVGLLLIGALAYGGELLAGAQDPERDPLLARWRARLGTLRWYVPVMAPLGGLLGVAWSLGPWAFLIGLTPLIGAQFTFRNQIALDRATRDLRHTAMQRESLAARLERLQALATTLIGTLDTQRMLEVLCERLAALLDAPWGWVVLLEEGQPRLVATHNLPVEDGEAGLTNEHLYAPLLARGQVLLIADERCQELAPLPIAAASNWSAVLSIPLQADKRALGTICLAFDRLRGLDADEQRVLTAFARQAAVTLQNAHLFNELRSKQAELIQSSKLAAVGTFAAGIAHEFNNLLGGMLGYAELGAGAESLEEKNHALDVVIQACRRGRSITRGLLTFARRQEHTRAPAHLAEAIDEVLQLVELDLAKARIQVVREVEPTPRTVCDIGQIAQVVLNLVTNARDAMKPGGGTLTIGLRERRGMLELSVADTGHGIPDELRDKIFEPFVTTKGALGGSQTPGTGLGLSISYGIVHDHGGTIHVASDVGRGTTMTVRLPIIAPPLDDEEEETMAVGRDVAQGR